MTMDSEDDVVSSRSGGADLNASHDITIGGDVVGRDKIVQTINNLADPTLKQAYLKGEIARIESEIDQLETEIDAVAQELTNKIDPGALSRAAIKLALLRASVQWLLHQLSPRIFRHASEVSRLYEAHRRKSDRVDALRTYVRDLKEVSASL